ncbi:hypothetical protein [Cohnella cellulosilytica]|uniref:Uncharacterized protein n=1 Tax=Cohnella cellulosilytica TaxID=986710 RepID=A0ABW2FA63_9BACL
MTRNWAGWELSLKKSFEEIAAAPTPDQLNHIKQKVSQSRQRRKKTKILAASTAALLMALLVIGVQLFNQQNERGLNVPDGQRLALPQTQETRGPSDCTFLDKPSSVNTPLSDQQLLAQLHTLGIAESSSDCVLYQQKWGEDGILVFSSTLNEDHKGMVWKANFLSRIEDEWTRISGGTLDIDFPSKDEVKRGVATAMMFVPSQENFSPALIYGNTLNPWVSSIVITDQNGLEQSATYFRGIWGGHSLWFAIPSNLSSPEYMIQELDSNGHTIETYSFSENKTAHGQK